MKIYLGLVIIAVFLLPVLLGYSQVGGAEKVVVREAVLVDITPPWDSIDSGTAECIIDAIKFAEGRNAALIYRVESYGGYLDAAYSIADAIFYSKTITIAYVERKAYSAATFILLPADYIALQRGSTIGAMQPVLVNPVTGEIVFVNESKVIEPIVGKARVYATSKGRNVSLIEDFVYKSRVVDSTTAVSSGIADVEVSDFNELLSKLHSLTLKKNGVTYELQVTAASVITYSCSLRSRFLSMLSNAYLSNILVTIGVLAAIFGLVSGKLIVLPLAIAMILLGLVGVGVNPNVVSLVLIVLGATLLALELFVLPGFGIAGVSGIVMLTLGFALLPAYIPTGIAPTEEYLLALRAAIIGTSVTLGAFFGLVLFKVIQVKRKKPVSYTPEGKVGVAISNIEPGAVGFVKVEGEYWRATSEEHIREGEEVVVVSMRSDGILVVKKKSSR